MSKTTASNSIANIANIRILRKDSNTRVGILITQKYSNIRNSNNRALLTSNQHHADAEHFLGVGVGRHVTEADRREAAEGKV